MHTVRIDRIFEFVNTITDIFHLEMDGILLMINYNLTFVEKQ